MCSSGFLQGLIGSPTQCGLPVVVIVPLSLLAPGTHGHPSLSISTPLPPVAITPGCILPSPYPPMDIFPTGYANTSVYACNPAVGPLWMYQVDRQVVGQVIHNLVWHRQSLARHSNGYLPQVTHDSSQYACNKRTGASWLSIHTCAYAWVGQGVSQMPRGTGI